MTSDPNVNEELIRSIIISLG